MTTYFRPIVQADPGRPDEAVRLAGGWGWFTHVERLSRNRPPKVLPVRDCPSEWLDRLTMPRPDIAGLSFEAPRIMGILNVTPDSFSDGGEYEDPARAVTQAQNMLQNGAHILDVGGESTRPGAAFVSPEDEISRTQPIVRALRQSGCSVAISVDTRKSQVATAALDAGADMINDVSGFTYDPGLARVCATNTAPVCVMHAQGDPATMQNDPTYDDVLLDVYDFLAARIEVLVQAGIRREQIIADPGIGFGKTLTHNLALLQRISLFHGLGVAILLGASRKRFIGTLGGAPLARDRAPGSLAVALAAIAQGVQTVRVHDVGDTAQAIALWDSVRRGA